jgi:hypothetical protein
LPLSPVDREVINDLELRTRHSNFHFWPSRDRRCLGTNSYFQRVRLRTASAFAVRGMDRAFLDELLADPEGPFQRAGRCEGSAAVRIDVLVNGVPRRALYQRYPKTSWIDPVKTLMRRSAALQTWWFGHALRDRFVPTPRPLALIHRSRFGLPWDGYLLREAVDGATPLDQYLASLHSFDPAQRRVALQRRIEQVAHLVRVLHERGLSHVRLGGDTVFVGDAPDLASRLANPHPWLPIFDGVWLMDLVGLSCHFPMPRRLRVQNLARLNAGLMRHAILSRTDRLTFLGTYLQWDLHGRTGWKAWWREIASETQKLVGP